jgi:hypothetical protein
MLSIEYVIRLIILLVVLSVVTMLILNWYNNVRNPDILPDGNNIPPNTRVIEKSVFTSRNVAKYIDSCYRMAVEKSRDFVCYVLQGSFDADEAAVRGNVTAVPDINEQLKIRVADFSVRQSVVIQFEDLGDKIIVS